MGNRADYYDPMEEQRLVIERLMQGQAIVAEIIESVLTNAVRCGDLLGDVSIEMNEKEGLDGKNVAGPIVNDMVGEVMQKRDEGVIEEEERGACSRSGSEKKSGVIGVERVCATGRV